MDFTALKTALKRYGFDDSDPLDAWLNSAMHELVAATAWPWLNGRTTIVLAIGSVTPAVPAAFKRVISLRNSDLGGQKLEEWEVTRFEREIESFTATGIPDRYVTYGMTDVEVYPVPTVTTNLRLVYQKKISDMVAGADTPGAGIIPVSLHYPIVLGAAAKGLQAENEEDRSTTARNEFETLIAREATNNDLSLDEPRAVVDVMDY